MKKSHVLNWGSGKNSHSSLTVSLYRNQGVYLVILALNLGSDETLRFHPDALRHLKELISVGESFHYVNVGSRLDGELLFLTQYQHPSNLSLNSPPPPQKKKKHFKTSPIFKVEA